MITQSQSNVFKQLQDLFPDKVAIGGGLAILVGLKTPLKTADVDVYLHNVEMTSQAFEIILKRIVFAGKDTRLLPDVGDGNYGSTGLPIRRRIQFVDLTDNVTYDFIFTHSNTRVIEDLILSNQSSALSEILLKLDFSPKGYREIHSTEFNDLRRALLTGRSAPTLNINYAKCTDEHLGKLVRRCLDLKLSVVFLK